MTFISCFRAIDTNANLQFQVSNEKISNNKPITSIDVAMVGADKFITDHNLPPYSFVELDAEGNITIAWEKQFYHQIIKGNQVAMEVSVTKAELILRPNSVPSIQAWGTQVEPYLPAIEFQWTYPTTS